MAADVPDPKVLAMLVADYAHRDPRTNKLSVFGIFDGFAGPRLPVVPAHLTIVVSLTDGRGAVPFALRIIDADEALEPVHEFRGVVSFPAPLQTATIVHDVAGVAFAAEGQYRIQLLVRGRVLFERRLEVRVGPVPRP